MTRQNEEKCELLQYIDSSLAKYFEKPTVLKKTPGSRVELYVHKSTSQKLIKRVMPNRNDGVYRALRAKPCPNTPCIYEVCSQDSDLIVLEEFIEGVTLQDFLQRKTVTAQDACRVVISLCDTLSFLHAQGIIHRDVKPANVMISKDGSKVFLIDFSIARAVSADADNDTEAFGTVGYAPPEQYGLSQSQNTNDLYALGVMLNIMLTGSHPTLKLPKGKLRKVVEKATSLTISERYQSAEEFSKAVKKAMD